MRKELGESDKPVAYDLATSIESVIPEDIEEAALILDASFDAKRGKMAYYLQDRIDSEPYTEDGFMAMGELDFPYEDEFITDEILPLTLKDNFRETAIVYNGEVISDPLNLYDVSD